MLKKSQSTVHVGGKHPKSSLPNDNNNYQARLDKVLEKFEETSKNDYIYKIDSGFGIRYYNKEFRMFCYTEPNFNWCKPFTLNTVESLIKDLEEE